MAIDLFIKAGEAVADTKSMIWRLSPRRLRLFKKYLTTISTMVKVVGELLQSLPHRASLIAMAKCFTLAVSLLCCAESR